jgi:hypothetical protein
MKKGQTSQTGEREKPVRFLFYSPYVFFEQFFFFIIIEVYES